LTPERAKGSYFDAQGQESKNMANFMKQGVPLDYKGVVPNQQKTLRDLDVSARELLRLQMGKCGGTTCK
jgi:hypothetical protein